MEDHDVFHDLQLVIARLRGDTTVTWKAAAKALIRLLDRAADFLPEQQTALPRAALADDALAATLEAHLPARHAAGPAEVAAIDWKAILPLLLQLIQKWLLS